MSPGIPRRTLQRHLAYLIEQGRLAPSGKARGRRYQIISEKFKAQEPGPSATSVSDVVPLSPEAIEIRGIIAQPLSTRRPVGYKASFLGDYEPNATAYLSPALRTKLSELGQVPGNELPAGTYFRKVMDRLLIDLSWNSSRLEGNTYSLLETERLLELGESAVGKDAREAQMILNHKAAIEMLADQAEEIGFNRYTICNLHALLADNLLADPAASGRLRSKPVGITGTVFHPLEVPQAIEDNFQQILDKATAIGDAFEQAFFVMVHIPYLQPFEDVNKRVSRLAANIPLVRRNLCPLSFVDVPVEDYVGGTLGVYELNRIDYLRDVFLWAYTRSCARYSAIRQSLGEPDLFRLKYRVQIAKLVADVVRAGMDKSAAVKQIATDAGDSIPAADRKRFSETVETELTSLHGGNIARYRLRPAEFELWKKNWR
jgi:fido (protein-threonine AMPylation protein)